LRDDLRKLRGDPEELRWMSGVEPPVLRKRVCLRQIASLRARLRNRSRIGRREKAVDRTAL
jgi:hypothetical protein